MNALAILAALVAGIGHAPAPPLGCSWTATAIMVSDPTILSGEFRSDDGGCIVWVNARNLEWLTRLDVCQLGAHEAGHLGGLRHRDAPLVPVMASPFTPLGGPWCK